jgi:hypothetical protein
MSRLALSPQAVLDFSSSPHPFGENTEPARSAPARMKWGCKRFEEALSVTSRLVFETEKSHTLPRSRGRWNLDLSRGEVINPRNACGDDAKAIPITVLARMPPAAMMLIYPSGPASVQKSTFSSARLHFVIFLILSVLKFSSLRVKRPCAGRSRLHCGTCAYSDEGVQ